MLRARTNKNAEVLAMLKRAKGTILAELIEATSWQARTVRGFVSILGGKGGERHRGARDSRIAK
jgi:hypothetical protein